METAILFFATILVTACVMWLMFRTDLNKVRPLQIENARLEAQLKELTDRDELGRYKK